MLQTVTEAPLADSPAAPNTRLSFGERAAIKALRINITYHDLSPIPPKGPLEPRRDNVPRRRIASDKTVRKTSDSTVKAANSPCEDRQIIAKDLSSAAITQELHSLQELVPNLFVAFAEDDEDDDHGRPIHKVRGDAFTHIVSISSEPSKTGAGAAVQQTVDPNNTTKRLHLLVPDNSNDNGQTVLTPDQLEAARDFLSQAMPRAYHLPHTPGELPDVCILITTVASRPADAMSVAACYLAFESGNSAQFVLECLNGEEDISATWRGILSIDGIELVETVARK